TVIGLQAGVLLGGAILTETIFSWPGVGRYIFDAINYRDYPVIQSGILVIAFIFVIINLLVDLLYAYIDPRIKVSAVVDMKTTDKHSLLTETNSEIDGDSLSDMEGRKSSPMRDAFKQLRKSKLATVGFFIITMFIIIGFIAPMLTPYGFDEQNLAKRLQPPSNEHWFGTDDLG